MFTEKEVKFLRLALDKSTTDGEWKNAIVMFGKSLRDRNISVETMDGKPQPQPQRQYSKSTGGTKWGTTKMPFGKYKGEQLEDIDVNYLHWAMGWIHEDEGRTKSFGWLVTAIENYMET